MSALTPFVFNGAQFRSLNQDGVLWFSAADACACLDIKEPKDAVARLDEDERGRFKIATLGGEQETAFVTEAGLYSLVLSSRKPEAKAFKRWVTHEVLPALRKNGTYSIVDRLSRRDLAMLIIEADMAREQAEAQTKALESLRAQEAPLVSYAAKVQGSPTSYSVDTTAKELGYPVKKFREWVQGKYLFRRGRDWLPRAEYQGRGLFEVSTRTYEHEGINFTYHVSLVTGPGRIALQAAWERATGEAPAEGRNLSPQPDQAEVAP